MLRLKDFLTAISIFNNIQHLVIYDNFNNEIDYTYPDRYINLLIKNIYFEKDKNVSIDEYKCIIFLSSVFGDVSVINKLFNFDDIYEYLIGPDIIVIPIEYETNQILINTMNQSVIGINPVFTNKHIVVEVILSKYVHLLTDPFINVDMTSYMIKN